MGTGKSVRFVTGGCLVSFAERLSFRVIALCSVLLAATSTAEIPVTEHNPYDQLCSIYEEELAGKHSPGPATFQRLANRLDEELPELDGQLEHLANFPKEEFYPALKEMAESDTGKAWECDFMRRRHKSFY